MLTMYPGMVNSPITELAEAIDDTQTSITVVDGTKLPDAPNLAMIGLGEDTETILYTAKSGNVLSGVTRGFQGTAKGWPQGARIARFFSAYDQNAIQQNIQTLKQEHDEHLNDKLQDGVHGLATTQDLTLYVDATNGDDNNDGQTPQTAFRTIQKAIDSLPKYIAHSVVINVAPGDYSNEDVGISGFIGNRSIQLIGDTVVPDTCVVDRIFPSYLTVPIHVMGFRCLGIGKAGAQVQNCVVVTFEYLKIDNQDGQAGVYVNASKAFVRNSTISNRGTAIHAIYLGEVSSINNTGTNNSVVLRADASVIRKGGTQPSGTTQELIVNGGQIL